MLWAYPIPNWNHKKWFFVYREISYAIQVISVEKDFIYDQIQYNDTKKAGQIARRFVKVTQERRNLQSGWIKLVYS